MSRVDHEFLEDVRCGRVPPGEFRHRDHVRYAYLLCRERPLEEVLVRARLDLQLLARQAGRPELYHETMTWAFVFLIHERLQDAPAGEGFEEFVGRHPELLGDARALLAGWYEPERLASDAARRSFLFPEPRSPQTGSPSAAGGRSRRSGTTASATTVSR